MSKSSTSTTSKHPSQLSSKSAWSRGPPAAPSSSSPRSASPAPSTPTSATAPSNAIHATHSRRSSMLGQGVPIKEGVSVSRNIAAAKAGSMVSFGSIDDVAAPISSSPGSAPAVKSSDGVKSFGSVVVQNGESAAASKSAITNRRSPTSTAPSMTTSSSVTTSSTTPTTAPSSSTPSPAPKINKRDIAKLFMGPSVSAAPTPPSHPPSESTSSPATRPANLPPTGYGAPSYPQGPGLRPQGPSAPTAAASPRSPSYQRSMANGQNGNVTGRPPSVPGSAPGNGPPAMPSPRMAPMAPGQAPGMPPPQVAWNYYYPHYPGMPPPEGMYSYAPGWGIPQQMPPHHPHQQPPPPPPHLPPGGPTAPSTGMPMSPRNPPPPLAAQTPSTPTLNHAMPVHSHPPPNQVPPNSVTSPPPTPSTTANGSSMQRLNSGANAFVPGKKISIKSSDGKEVTFDDLKRSGQSPIVGPGSPIVVKPDFKRSNVRIESPEQKERRIAEEAEKARKEREAVEAKAREEREKKEAAERKEREEREAKANAEREKQEAEERERKATEARIAREKEEAEERERKAAEARAAREKEEAERKQREEEAAERLRKEAEEKKRKEEEEAAERAKREAERAKKEEEDKRRQEAEAAAKAKADEEAKAVAAAIAEKVKKEREREREKKEREREEGEIIEDKPPRPPAQSSKPSEKESLRIDTALPSTELRRRPGPLNLKDVASKSISPAPLSALATARIIDDLNTVSYPEGVKSPKIELNVNAPKGKFKYDREFLLQFMSVCKEKPDNLPPLDAIGLEPSDQTFSMTRGGSGRRTTSMATPSSARNPGLGLGFIPSSLGKGSGSSPFAGMGNFSTTTASKLSSEERFALASSARSASTSGLPPAVANRQPPMSRQSSQGGPGDRRRTRSSRGHTRDSARPTAPQHPSQPPANMAPPFEPVVPLQHTENRWVASSTKRNVIQDVDQTELVDRKVKALLNKLTMERFDSISDQIIEWANKSETEKNGQTLIQVIRLVFEKATDEATFSEMYARLCRKMMEQISTKVQDDGILNSEGKPFAGGQLFRKYLLNRCQEDFERGWVAKEATAAAAALKSTADAAVKQANEQANDKATDEVALYSDEYYAAAKAKRRGLGLIRFIGELFKLQMLTERIMHECVKKLLGNVENPEEEEIESLCKLLTTVGQILDTPKAHAHMDVYFSRMKELTKSKNVTQRMAFMLQDVIELREHKWIPRNMIAAPATIAQIHEAAAKEKAAADKEAALRQSAMTRGGSRRGADRSDGPAVGPDGWAIAGSNTTRVQVKAGDLSNFGKISKVAPMTFGPSGVFAKGKEVKGRDASVSRTASTRNMFDMLSQNTDMATEQPVAKSSRPPSRKPSADFTQSGIPDAPPQRRKLNLLPRSIPLEEQPKPDEGDEAGEDAEASGPSMSEEEAKRKIDEDIKELFNLRSLDEAESYFTSLPAEHHWRLVDSLVMKGIDSKAVDIVLVGDLLTRVNEKDLATMDALEEGFNSLAEAIDDIAIDVPKAFDTMARWLKLIGLDKDEERRTRVAGKVLENGDKLLSLLTT